MEGKQRMLRNFPLTLSCRKRQIEKREWAKDRKRRKIEPTIVCVKKERELELEDMRIRCRISEMVGSFSYSFSHLLSPKFYMFLELLSNRFSFGSTRFLSHSLAVSLVRLKEKEKKLNSQRTLRVCVCMLCQFLARNTVLLSMYCDRSIFSYFDSYYIYVCV